MKNSKFATAIYSAKRFLGKHSPEICIAIGIVGLIGAGVHAVAKTPKAMQLLDDAAEQKKESAELPEEAELTVTEKVKAIAPCYIPAISMATVSAACIISGASIQHKRMAAVATAYKLSETALTDYKAQITEMFGEDKKKEIDSKINQKKIDNNTLDSATVLVTGDGDQLCYDSVSGRYFRSSAENIRRAVNVINRTMTYDNYVSLSDFYEEIGLEQTNFSDDVGWNLDDGLMDVTFDARLDAHDNPCIVVDYNVAPRYDYSKLM